MRTCTSLLRNLFLACVIPTALLHPQVQPAQKDPAALVQKYFSMTPEELFNVPTHLTISSGQDWLQTPAAAHILTQGDLENSGHTHLAEQLRMVPGVMVSQTAPASWSISTRSFQNLFAGNQLVLQDGREIYTPTFGGVFWDTADLPVEILDSIEVTRGPGATLWGSNAVNGIINIRTLSAEKAQENIANIGGGGGKAMDTSASAKAVKCSVAITTPGENGPILQMFGIPMMIHPVAQLPAKLVSGQTYPDSGRRGGPCGQKYLTAKASPGSAVPLYLGQPPPSSSRISTACLLPEAGRSTGIGEGHWEMA